MIQHLQSFSILPLIQVSDGCGIIFNPLFVKKNGYGAMAQRQYKITQMQHTKMCSMKQLFELSSLMVKISLEF
jgi:hypothetical protein